MPIPRVSVITTTCNGERFLAQTIESILSQTCNDFEYLIVDDASTDCSPQIINGYAARDGRIRVMINKTRLGPAGALNCALHAARGAYLANLDHDDLAMPNRLEDQTAFLEREPSVGVTGSYVRCIDVDGRVTASMRYPVEPALIRWGLFFRGCVAHSAALMRRDLVLRAGGYSPHHPYACDYELWTRLVQITDLANIPEYLAAYRRTEGQTSRTQWKSQQGQVLLLIYATIYRVLGIRVALQAVKELSVAIREPLLSCEAEVMRTAQLLETILGLYMEKVRPDEATTGAIRKDCAVKMFLLARHHRELLSTQYDCLMEKVLQLDPLLLYNPDVKEMLAANNVAS
jgi:hypothetical protein